MNKAEIRVFDRSGGGHEVWLMFSHDSRRLFIGRADSAQDAAQVVNGFLQDVLFSTVQMTYEDRP